MGLFDIFKEVVKEALGEESILSSTDKSKTPKTKEELELELLQIQIRTAKNQENRAKMVHAPEMIDE